MSEQQKNKIPTVEDITNKKGFAPQGSKRVKNAQTQQTEDSSDKFEADFHKYVEFVDLTTSECTKQTSSLVQRILDLEETGCNVSRLTTAAAGLSAEAGEFQEIVKKMLFQGKPWNDDNHEHLIKELGDIMWYAAQACLALGVSFDEVIFISTLKLAARYPEGNFSVDQSENRKDGDI
jgi:NTP pyrophosphatase (non-canonical NTP hydrolase)